MIHVLKLSLVHPIVSLISLLASTVYCDKPNLIIIMTDEHNLRTLGCYRDKMEKSQSHVWGAGVEVETPHIDSLANDGALFTNFNAVSPVCTPSRASFMTGLYPEFTGASGNRLPLDESAVTFAEILQKKNYHTGFIGKWHLNGDAKPGFANDTRRFGFADNKYQFNRGHWKFFQDIKNGTIDVYTYPDRDKVKGSLKNAYATDFLFNKAFKFIKGQIKEDRHFALMLSIPDPHGPNIIRPPYNRMFDHMKFKVPKTAVAAYHKRPANPGWCKTISDNPMHANQTITNIENDETSQKELRNYFGMVKLIDDKIGKLISMLENQSIDNNTIVVFTRYVY